MVAWLYPERFTAETFGSAPDCEDVRESYMDQVLNVNQRFCGGQMIFLRAVICTSLLACLTPAFAVKEQLPMLEPLDSFMISSQLRYPMHPTPF